MTTQLNLAFYEEGNCPFCNSDNLEGGICEPEHDYVYREFNCNECKQAWTETYKCVEISTQQPTEQILEITNG